MQGIESCCFMCICGCRFMTMNGESRCRRAEECATTIKLATGMKPERRVQELHGLTHQDEISWLSLALITWAGPNDQAGMY